MPAALVGLVGQMTEHTVYSGEKKPLCQFFFLYFLHFVLMTQSISFETDTKPGLLFMQDHGDLVL